MADKRIYRVDVNLQGIEGEGDKVLLVNAGTQAQALKFATDKIVSVRVASPDDLITLTKRNVEVQEAQ
jgi:hypothetical protein